MSVTSSRIPDGQRVNWWALLMLLHKAGFSINAIVKETGIPKSTLLGFKNLNVEPKHKDADALIWMWAEYVGGDIPLQHGSVRTGLRNAGEFDPAFLFDERQLMLPLDDSK
jgi:hypothetical protein